MKFVTYNENSILNNNVVRAINAIILIWTMCICVYSVNEHGHIPAWFLFILFLTGFYLYGFCLNKTLSEITFFEWSIEERRKKKEFTIQYSLISGLFCIVFCFGVSGIYNIIYEAERKDEFILANFFVYLFAALYVLFNLFNIMSLFLSEWAHNINREIYDKRPYYWQTLNYYPKEESSTECYSYAYCYYKDDGVNERNRFEFGRNFEYKNDNESTLYPKIDDNNLSINNDFKNAIPKYRLLHISKAYEATRHHPDSTLKNLFCLIAEDISNNQIRRYDFKSELESSLHYADYQRGCHYIEMYMSFVDDIVYYLNYKKFQ